ncbi:MAG: methionyl-tRNA formyltransferase [Alphaproteobacteria bacterium]|nr:methionyl-tRNA formyltransferase [Alphaproteobacteria bacterium]
MKIVFMGTPEFALTALQKIAQKHEIVCVYTREPQIAGRGNKLTKSPVHNWAEQQGYLVRTPKTLRTPEAQAEYRALNADIAVVAAYGLILPLPIIEAFPKGCINIHGSLLPRWRGAAPIQRAIEAGDDKSGITIMNIVPALDAGDMLLKAEIAITSETTGETLHDGLAELGADLITQALDNIDDLQKNAVKQDEKLVTYAAKLDKRESKIDFSQSAEILERKIRAFNPYPAMYFEYQGERIKVLRAKVVDQHGEIGEILEGEKALIIACKNKALSITELQRSGKKKMTIKEVLNGAKFAKITLL